MQTFKSQLAATLPDGWDAKESITILEPNTGVSVIASSEPLDRSMDAQQYAEIQGDLLRQEFTGYREFEFQQTTVLGGYPGYTRRFQWTPQGMPPVTQIQLYYAGNGRGYTATATAPSAIFESLEFQFRNVLNGLALQHS